MSYSIIQQGDTVQTYIKQVVCDTVVEVQELPTDWASGSTCIVIEDSSLWMLGNDKQWHEFE